MYTFRGICGNLIMRLCSLLPLQNKVVFSSFDGLSCDDNPRVICDTMRALYPQLEYIWLSYDVSAKIDGAKVVKAYSIKGLYHQATAKLWIFNSRQRDWTIKRRQQFYVQTWHGDVCIKKIEADAREQLGSYYMREAKHDSDMVDLMISGSNFRTNNYRNAFMYTGEILEYGTPTSVIYYEPADAHRNNVIDFYHLTKETKLALYCPTFRSNGSLEVYNINYEELLKVLKKKWPGKWVVLIRLHPKLQQFQSQIRYTDTILNGSAYLSTDELIIGSDLLITDYSSCMFQGLEAKKKVILYTPDLEEYIRAERGLYFDIYNLPFPTICTNDELSDIVMNFDEDAYSERAERLRKEIGYKTTLTSTRRIVKYVVNKVWKGAI